MIGQAVPLFQAGNLLTKEMLSAMKDYAFDFGELLYQNYSNGILCGCSITTTKSVLQLNRGIIIYNGKLYLVSQPLVEPYYATDKETVLKIRMKDEIKTQNFIYLEMETILDERMPREEDELEICRFKLQEGFRLRTEYQSFADRITAYDTVNIVHSPFSSYGRSGLSPVIIKDYAMYLESYHCQNPLDVMFSIQAHQSGGFAMNPDAVISYLVARLQIERKHYTNMECFNYLTEILREVSHEKKDSRKAHNFGRRVLLD